MLNVFLKSFKTSMACSNVITAKHSLGIDRQEWIVNLINIT
jgi:hypothetical protein